MEAQIKTTGTGIQIDVTDLGGKKEQLLEAFQECSEGRCTCPTQEYQKVEALEVIDSGDAIGLSITAKADQQIDTAEIEKCLEYTKKRVSESADQEERMAETLETTVDKFTFKVATDRLYNDEGVWAKPEGGLVRLGVSDFVQQHGGDVAFAEVKPVGTQLALGDELATIETIKVNISLSSPVSGEVREINPFIASAPEAINKDPYGAGWLALVRVADWEAEKPNLLDPRAYFARMKARAEQEVSKP